MIQIRINIHEKMRMIVPKSSDIKEHVDLKDDILKQTNYNIKILTNIQIFLVFFMINEQIDSQMIKVDSNKFRVYLQKY